MGVWDVEVRAAYPNTWARTSAGCRGRTGQAQPNRLVRETADHWVSHTPQPPGPLIHAFLKKIYPLRGPVPAVRVGGLDEGGHGSENFSMFWIHVWIPHENLSILSINRWGKFDPKPHAKKKQRTSAPKLEPDLLNILAILKGSWAAIGHPPCKVACGTSRNGVCSAAV